MLEQSWPHVLHKPAHLTLALRTGKLAALLAPCLPPLLRAQSLWRTVSGAIIIASASASASAIAIGIATFAYAIIPWSQGALTLQSRERDQGQAVRARGTNQRVGSTLARFCLGFPLGHGLGPGLGYCGLELGQIWA